MNSDTTTLRNAISDRDVRAYVSSINMLGESGLIDLIKNALISQDYEKAKFLWDLAWVIFAERQRCAFGENPRFVIGRRIAAFQELFYELDAFFVLKVPYDSWGHLVSYLSRVFNDEMVIDEVEANKFKQIVAIKKRDTFSGNQYSDAYIQYVNGAL